MDEEVLICTFSRFLHLMFIAYNSDCECRLIISPSNAAESSLPLTERPSEGIFLLSGGAGACRIPRPGELATGAEPGRPVAPECHRPLPRLLRLGAAGPGRGALAQVRHAGTLLRPLATLGDAGNAV